MTLAAAQKLHSVGPVHLKQKMENREALIGIIGMGYVGPAARYRRASEGFSDRQVRYRFCKGRHAQWREVGNSDDPRREYPGHATQWPFPRDGQ